ENATQTASSRRNARRVTPPPASEATARRHWEAGGAARTLWRARVLDFPPIQNRNTSGAKVKRKKRSPPCSHAACPVQAKRTTRRRQSASISWWRALHRV